MRSLIRLLGAVLVLALAVAAVEVLHPKGVLGLIDEFRGRNPAAAPAVRTGTPAVAVVIPTPSKPLAETWGPGAMKVLSWADRDADRGDFDGAVSNYSAARVLAASADERARATQGLEKALLAQAVVRGAPRVTGKPSDLDAEYQKKLAAVERTSDERAWLDLARWTAGAGLRERLPYVCAQTLDAAKPGGPVQAKLDDALAGASGNDRERLRGAMAARNFAKGPPLASLPTSPMTDSGIRTSGSSGTGEASGIGGVNEKGIPFGNFSAATRERLREAIVWERNGTVAYNAAGPGSPNRTDNRHTALKFLRDAKDVYVAAQAEDSDSRDLDDRLKHVMMMIAQLRKDEGIGK